jgi:hypothetical protein
MDLAMAFKPLESKEQAICTTEKGPTRATFCCRLHSPPHNLQKLGSADSTAQAVADPPSRITRWDKRNLSFVRLVPKILLSTCKMGSFWKMSSFWKRREKKSPKTEVVGPRTIVSGNQKYGLKKIYEPFKSEDAVVE